MQPVDGVSGGEGARSAAGVGAPDGIVIEGYTALRPIGSGGFSTVYKAYQERFDRVVALKVLDVELETERSQQQFRTECRTAGRVSRHPNIVTVLDSGLTDAGRPFIVSEFMHHGSLEDEYLAEGPLEVALVLSTGIKLCGALSAVHDAGIQHRDVKPANILVSEYGEPELADFGISAALTDVDGIDDEERRTTYYAQFTPDHAAPELLEGQASTAVTDVYALASTLYELLTGTAPFEGPDDESMVDFIRKVLHQPVPPSSQIPEPLMAILRQAMAKRPEDRFPSAGRFGEALQGVQRELGFPQTDVVTRADGLAGSVREAPAAAHGAGRRRWRRSRAEEPDEVKERDWAGLIWALASIAALVLIAWFVVTQSAGGGVPAAPPSTPTSASPPPTT